MAIIAVLTEVEGLAGKGASKPRHVTPKYNLLHCDHCRFCASFLTTHV